MLKYDPLDHEVHENPYPIYKELRDSAPLYRNEERGYWVLSRYGDCLMALRNFKLFTNKYGNQLEPLSEEQWPTILSTDPPDHTRLRGLTSRLFTPQAVSILEDTIRSLARRLLEPHLDAHRIDLVRDFSAHLPIAVIGQLLGVPPKDYSTLQHWTDLTVLHGEDEFEMTRVGREAFLKVYKYYEDMLNERLTAGGDARDDIVAKLSKAYTNGLLSHQELLAYLYLITVGGHETTTKFVGNIAYQLYKHPDQRRRLLADPSLIRSAIEEGVRYDGPVHICARGVARETELYGRILRPGEKVGIIFMSANRDERHYPNPDVFDVARNPVDHLGFGGGLHSCLGAALARLESRIAIEEILRAMPNYEVDTGGIERIHAPSVIGYSRLPVVF
jgi:cytochrome P450